MAGANRIFSLNCLQNIGQHTHYNYTLDNRCWANHRSIKITIAAPFSAYPSLNVYSLHKLLSTCYKSKLHTLKNPRMYNLPKFDFKKAAKSLIKNYEIRYSQNWCSLLCDQTMWSVDWPQQTADVPIHYKELLYSNMQLLRRRWATQPLLI